MCQIFEIFMTDSNNINDEAKKAPIDVLTFGCRLNIYESEIIRDLSNQSQKQDVVIINSCAVTAEAERKIRQKVRQIKRNEPHKKIMITGCSAQIHPEMWQKMPEVDMVFGNEEKLDPHFYQTTLANSQDMETVHVKNIMDVKETASHLIHSVSGKARAIVQVQNGCDHRCTFCIIPYGRGPSRSVPIGAIVKQIDTLLKQGYQEIVFTGVDLTSYGTDLPGQPTLGQMLRRVLSQLPQLRRLRLSSLDSIEIDDELTQLIIENHRIMPHLHLSLQSGDNMILKRMKRRHQREHAIDFCQSIKKYRPEVTFGADIIAGFPTETDEMFDNTLRIIDECELTYLHIFPYSARKGTPAARMPQVPMNIRKQRASILRHRGQEKLSHHLNTYLQNEQTVYEVLIENPQSGRMADFAPVQLIPDDSQNLKQGMIVKVRITGKTSDHLVAKVLHTDQ